MSLRTPSKRQVHEGSTIKIYDRAGQLQGRAKLLYRKPSKFVQDNLPYARHEKGNQVQNPTIWIWSYERWIVEWIEHGYYRPGDRNSTEVNYFVKIATNHPAQYDINNVAAEPTGRVIFLEEEGVLSKGGKYLPAAVKSLNKLAGRMRADIVVWTHDVKQVRDRFEIHGVKRRVIGYLDSRSCRFADCVQEYLETNEVERYVIVTGDTNIESDHVIKAHPKKGLVVR